LRAFESGDADVGFLGAGLHRRRPGAIDFHTDPLGDIVLRTGAEAGPGGAPGVATELVDRMDPARFLHLGIQPGQNGGTRWGGKPCELRVDGASPYLVEVASVVAATLGAPGHEVTA